MALRIGIDIGGTKANVGILGEDGSILAKRKLAVPANHGCAATVLASAKTVHLLLQELGVTPADVTFCGIGVPGTVSEDGRTVRLAPNLGWKDEPCAVLFEELTGIPATLVQDAKAAALGEYRQGAARGRKLALCVTLGTGIGAGIVWEGKLFHGALGGAGEVGHIPARPGGRLCGCGQRGCVETYSAGRGIAQTASEHPHWQGRAVTSEEVFAAAAAGDEVALGILREAVDLLGAALTSVVNVLSPDAVIFSGGMCSQRTLFVDPLIGYLRAHAYALSADERLLTAVAELGEDAPMVGAALLRG